MGEEVVEQSSSSEDFENNYELEYCPNCGSNAVGCDNTGTVPFLECF